MQQRGWEPNVITCNALVSGCERVKKPEKALELLAEMQQNGVEPNIITYNSPEF